MKTKCHVEYRTVFLYDNGKKITNHPLERIDSVKEYRYCLCDYFGPISRPSVFYKNLSGGDGSFVVGYLSRDPVYAREVDETYFKYFDDLTDVVSNIVSSQEILTKHKDNTKKWKRTLEKLMIRLDIDSLKRILSIDGSLERKRKDLTGLDKYHSDELDFVQ